MSQYTSYYLYQKYEKIGEQDWQPCYPNIYSISGDSEIVMPLVMKSSADTACGYIPPSEPIYRWVDLDPAVDYYCSGTTKFYKQQMQVSYNSGQTWENVTEYQMGASAETHSIDCGAIIIYKWVNLDPAVDYYCSGTTKFYKQQKQISYNGGQTWEYVDEYQWGNSAQTQSEDCGYVPPTPIYRWVNMDISSNWICDECTPIEPIYRWVDLDPSTDYICSGTTKYYKQQKQVSVDSGQTWTDVDPLEYQMGASAETQSEDCSYSNQYLTFVARESGTFRLSGNSINYSLDNGTTWTTLASNTDSPTVASGSKIMWKGTLTPRTSGSIGIGRFSSTAQFELEGNAMSLLYGDDFSGQTSLSGKDCAFAYLFSGCTKMTNAENLILPATTMSSSGYAYMFDTCSSLTKLPKLPATTLAPHCYRTMFGRCHALTTVENNYLSAATTMVDACYINMFINCSSLVKGPDLTASTLATQCYQGLFNSCTSLNYIKCLATDISATNCTYSWVTNVASNGTFVKASSASWPSGTNGIPNTWTVQNA